MLSADDGKLLATLPIGHGTDGGGFNPATREAFSSQGDGTLTIIKETSPTSFEVAQTVQTKPHAKTCALDTKNNQIILIATEPPATPPTAAGTTATTPEVAASTPPASGQNAANGGRRGGRGGNNNGPAMLDILVVGRGNN